MRLIDYTLPAFVFLDGNSHLGDTLEYRTVIMHVRSCTVLEVVAIDEIAHSDFKTETFNFHYLNSMGITEQHMFAVHFTLSDDIASVFELAKDWYCEYLKWEDENILGDI